MISALSNAPIVTAPTETAGGVVAAADAEKTARLNASLPSRLESIKAAAAKFLDEKQPLKERLNGFNEYRKAMNSIDDLVEAAGFGRRSRGLQQSDPIQAAHMKETAEIQARIYSSDLYLRQERIINASAIPAAKALAEDKHPAVGTLSHWDSLSVEEQDIAFEMYHGATFSDGSRAFSSKSQYRANLEGIIKDHDRNLADGMIGWPARAERLEQANRIMQTHAGDYKAWQASRGNIGVVVDKIDLSAEGAKAAAKTLSQEAPADDALDAQLKALETLKQINAQHRDWLKSIEESDKDKADRPDQSELPEQTQNPQPGSRLSVAA